jgi:hypothetical protein
MVFPCQPIFLVGTLGQIEVEMSRSNFCTFAIYYGKSLEKKNIPNVFFGHVDSHNERLETR